MSGDDTLRAIDARLADLDAEALEAERAALLTELDSGRPVTELRDRILDVAMDGLARAETMPEAARTWTQRAAFAELLTGSGIVDAVPGTLRIEPLDSGLLSVSVASASSERVTLGTLDPAILAQAERTELLRAREALVETGRGGIEREHVVAAVMAGALQTDRGWELPTQAATAEALDLADARRIRQVQGPRRWAGIEADARARLTERQSG